MSDSVFVLMVDEWEVMYLPCASVTCSVFTDEAILEGVSQMMSGSDILNHFYAIANEHLTIK